jgi:hypothetical protein
VDQALTLRRELNKTKREMQIPVDPEHAPELMAVIERWIRVCSMRWAHTPIPPAQFCEG